MSCFIQQLLTLKIRFPDDLRQQLGEQLRCLETKVETENTILGELQEFIRRRAEIETAYGKQLERLCRQMLTQHKADRVKRENWRNYSTFRCWQAAVLNARSAAQDHVLLGEILGSHVATRLSELIEDSQRLFRKCKAMHTEYQDELIKMLAELQSAMKTYHNAFGEFATAQHKLGLVESQRDKLQMQLSFKHKAGKESEEREKDRMPRSASAEKHVRVSRDRRVASRRQDSDPMAAPDDRSASLDSYTYSHRNSQAITASASSSAVFGLPSASTCGSMSLNDHSLASGGNANGVAPVMSSSVNTAGTSVTLSSSESPRDSAVGSGSGESVPPIGSLKGLSSSSSTLLKKLRSVDRQCEKKRAKCAECRAKALKSRNEYLLALEACNASLSRLFTDDVPDLIDCMTCGYHTSLCNSMLMLLYSEASLAQTHQANVETIGRCCSHLDAREDKQRFLKERGNYTSFSACRHWGFQPARGDPNAPNYVVPPPNSVLQDELLARCAALRNRLDQLRSEADSYCKSLRDCGTRLLEQLATPDYDVAARFDVEHRRERDGPVASVSPLRPSSECIVNPVVATSADAFDVDERREARVQQVELELSFVAAFRKYVAANQQATRVHAQLEAVQRSLLDNPDYVRLAHALARAGAAQRVASPSGNAQIWSSTQQANSSTSKSHGDVLVRLVCAPIERPRRRRLLKAPTLVRPRLFGGYLEDYVIANGCDIPPVVTSSIRVLSRFGLHHQGLFRVSGAATDVSDLRAAYERGDDPLDELLVQCDTASIDRRSSSVSIVTAQKINAIASLLKLYFRELAEPLFPTELFDDFVATIYCLQLRDFQLHPLDARRACLARLRELVTSLSRPVRATMRYLFAFLKHVSEACEDNMMDPANLAICFGPTLMPIPDQDQQVRLQSHVNELVKAFIVYSADIFDDSTLSGPLYDREQFAKPASDQTQAPKSPNDERPCSPAPLSLSQSTRNLTGSTLTLTRVGVARQPAVVVVQVHASVDDRDPRTSPLSGSTRLVDASTQTASSGTELGIEVISSDLGASLSSNSSQTRLVSSASPMNDPSSNIEQISPKSSSLEDEANANYDMGTLRPDEEDEEEVAGDLGLTKHERLSSLTNDTLLYAAASSADSPCSATGLPVTLEVVRESSATYAVATVDHEPLALIEAVAMDRQAACVSELPAPHDVSVPPPPPPASVTQVDAEAHDKCAGVVVRPNGISLDLRRLTLPSIAECASETNIDSEDESPESENPSSVMHGRSRSVSTDDYEYDDEEGEAQVAEAVAACDYRACNDQEVSFRQGDTILLFSRVSDDWWTGVVRGQEGLVPHRCVTIGLPRPSCRRVRDHVRFVEDHLPPPFDDSHETEDEREIDQALEQAMHGIGPTPAFGLESDDCEWPEVPNGAEVDAEPSVPTAISVSGQDESPDSEGFPLPPTPSVLRGYEDLLDSFGASCSQVPPDEADDEMLTAALRQQVAGDLLEDLAARFEGMCATPTSAEISQGRANLSSRAAFTCNHDGRQSQPSSLAEVFAKTDHPTLKKGTNMSSNSSSSIDTSTSQSNARTNSPNGSNDSSSSCSVWSASNSNDCVMVTATAVPIRIAFDATGPRFDLCRPIVPESPTVGKLAFMTATPCLNDRTSNSSDSGTNDASWRKPPPAIMPKPRPPQRTSSLCLSGNTSSNGDGGTEAAESTETDGSSKLTTSASASETGLTNRLSRS